MGNKLLLSLAFAAIVLPFVFLVTPLLRVRRERRKEKILEACYERGPNWDATAAHEGSRQNCEVCGFNRLRRTLVGASYDYRLLRQLNPRFVERARYYEYRCSKCESLAGQEKVLMATQTPDSGPTTAGTG